MKCIEEKIQAIKRTLDEKVKEIQQIVGEKNFNFKDFYFAGGCIYCLWNDKEVKDYDIFCKSYYAINKLKKFFKENPDKSDITTSNAITMGKYQFITKHIGQPDVEVAKFDFKHNCYYYDNTGLHDLYGFEYINDNKLHFNSDRARDILNVVTRIPKFVNRGMEISQKEILDILEMGTRPSKIFRERRAIKQRRSGRSRC